MEFSVYTLLSDVGWISLLMLVGNILRHRLRSFQALLLPGPITAGLLGLILGPEVLGLIPFSSAVNSYTSLLIAVVFAAIPYTMVFDRSVRSGAKAMWAYSTSMYVGQWGVFILLGVLVFGPVWGTEDWFGMILPVGFVGGFGTAAAVGSSLESAGAVGASSLGFTSATVGTLAAILGGILMANWGIRTKRTSAIPEKLPEELRSGYIAREEERPSIGRATTNPSALEPVALHVGVLAMTVFAAYLINQGINHLFPEVSIPLFAMSFVTGLIGLLLFKLFRHPNYIDRDTMSSVSGAATDYLIAFGIAAIVPAAVADYWLQLVVLFVAGIIYCLIYFAVIAPSFFGKQWIERAIFGWGWATAAVATGIALLKIVDPKLKSGTLNEYGVAYVGYAPFEIGMTIVAPIAVIAGWTLGLGIGSTLIAAAIILAAILLHWIPGRGNLAVGDAGRRGNRTGIAEEN